MRNIRFMYLLFFAYYSYILCKKMLGTDMDKIVIYKNLDLNFTMPCGHTGHAANIYKGYHRTMIVMCPNCYRHAPVKRAEDVTCRFCTKEAIVYIPANWVSIPLINLYLCAECLRTFPTKKEYGWYNKHEDSFYLHLYEGRSFYELHFGLMKLGVCAMGISEEIVKSPHIVWIDFLLNECQKLGFVRVHERMRKLCSCCLDFHWVKWKWHRSVFDYYLCEYCLRRLLKEISKGLKR